VSGSFLNIWFVTFIYNSQVTFIVCTGPQDQDLVQRKVQDLGGKWNMIILRKHRGQIKKVEEY
jgi:hypothetical protein